MDLSGRRRILAVIVLIFIFGIAGCRVLERPMLRNFQKKTETLLVNPLDFNIKEESLTTYEIDVELLVEKNQIVGGQRVIFINNSEDNLKEIYFNLYPNAFKEKETAPALFSEGIKNDNYTPGFIEIKGLKLEGKKTNYEISGKGETLLKIPLEEPLRPGEAIDIELNYLIQLPTLADRFGYYNGVYNLGNWHPILAVYDEEGWNLNPYYAIGDPFYSEASNYNVIIRAPKNIIIAATGNIKEQSRASEYSKWSIEARLVRDFAWAASADFNLVEEIVGDTAIKMYYLTKDASIRKKALEYTKSSLKIFQNVYGKYPYGQLSVVETYFPSGMEYPTLIYISEEYFRNKELQSMELVIVHEVGHQWWYGVVGNNQIKDAWLDESLTTYSELVYYREAKGESVAQQVHQLRNEATWNNSTNSLKSVGIWKGLHEYRNWLEYGSLVYSKGASMLVELEKLYGRNKVYEILNTYYNKYLFRIAKPEDFINTTNEVTKGDNEEFFNNWLKGR